MPQQPPQHTLHDQSPRPIIAIVSKQRITGANNGSSAYLLAVAGSLSEAGFDVHLIQPSPAIAGRSPFFRLGPELGVFAAHEIRGARRIGSRVVFADAGLWARALAGMAARLARKAGLKGALWRDRPAPYAVATDWLAADHAFLRRKLAPGTRAVIADYMFVHPAFDSAPEGAASAILMHDLFHARAAGDRDSVVTVTADEEKAMLGTADAVFAIQQAERDFLAREVPQTRAVLVPMPAFPVAAARPGRGDRVLMVGSHTAPNIEGLRDFLANAWPAIHEACPAARLQVAGTMGRAFAGESWPNVDFLGLVDDLEALYAGAGVVISPLTFGSGLKIKLVEGMAKGKAMVVSTVTLQGVEDLCEGGVVRCDDGPETAQAIVRLLGDAGARADLGERALAIARARFSAGAVHAELREWARGLL